EKPAGLGWKRFHRERRAESPLAAHADSKKRAQDQEDREIRREGSEQLHHRIKDDVGHERNATAELVAEPTKHESANRPHHQCERDGESNFRNAPAKIVANRNEHEGKEKEIERVEGPTKETGDERVPLIAIQKFEKPDRLHFLVSYLTFPEISRDVSTSVNMTRQNAYVSWCAISSKQN